MPVIQVHFIEGPDLETKRKVVQGITDVIMKEMGKKPEQVRVILNETPKTDYAIGGVLAADKDGQK